MTWCPCTRSTAWWTERRARERKRKRNSSAPTRATAAVEQRQKRADAVTHTQLGGKKPLCFARGVSSPEAATRRGAFFSPPKPQPPPAPTPHTPNSDSCSRNTLINANKVMGGAGGR